MYSNCTTPMDFRSISSPRPVVNRICGWMKPDSIRRSKSSAIVPEKRAALRRKSARPAVAELAARLGQTEFVGYEQLEADSIVQAILKGDRTQSKRLREGDEVEIILGMTPFYAEGGGQAGDQGTPRSVPKGRIDIRETTRPRPTLILHKGVVRTGSIREGERTADLSVNRQTRQDAARNHTATHLVHAALRDLLGPHVKQYGSLVAPNRLRFDFAHFRPLSSRRYR